MKQTIQERLTVLRQVMKEQGIHAFIFPSSDPHNSEYVAEHWKGREWISGFNGSAGTAVVTLKHAALWTDSRYFIAAAEQLAGTEYLLMKDRLPDTPSISEWIAQELSDYENPVVGVDGTVNTYASLCELMNELNIATFVTNLDPLATVWNDRPSIPKDKIVLHSWSMLVSQQLVKLIVYGNICRLIMLMGYW